MNCLQWPSCHIQLSGKPLIDLEKILNGTTSFSLLQVQRRFPCLKSRVLSGVEVCGGTQAPVSVGSWWRDLRKAIIKMPMISMFRLNDRTNKESPSDGCLAKPT